MTAVLARCAIILSLSATSANAAVVGVISEAQLTPNDVITWSQLPSLYQQLTTPQNVLSAGGLAATVVDPTGAFAHRLQGNGWQGNFVPGTHVASSEDGGLLSISFAAPVRGVGARIQGPNGIFNAQITVNNNPLTLFSEQGLSTGSADGSAIFIGLLSDTDDIWSVSFTVPNTTNAFAIGSLVLNTRESVPALPEPGSWLLLLVGFAMTGICLRKPRSAWSFAGAGHHRD